MKLTLIKLSMACLVFAVSHFLMPILFGELLAQIVYLSGKQGDTEFVYNLMWFLNEFSCYLLPMIGIGAIFFTDLFGEKKLRYPHTPRYKKYHCCFYYAAMTTAGFIASSAAAYISDTLTRLFDVGEIEDVIGSVAPQSTGGLWGYLICTCLIAPACEELLFRFALLKPLRRCGDWFAVIVSAVLFGVFHGNFDQAPYAIGVGIILGLVAVKSGSVLPSIILHSLNNILVSAVNYLPEGNEALSAISAIASRICTATLVFGLGAMAWLIFELKKEPPVRTHDSVRGKKMAKLLFTSPAFYIGIALCVALFF